MSTVSLDARTIKSLQPAFALWREYHPEKARYRFHARTRAAATDWQRSTRRALAETVGFLDRPKVPFQSRLIERVDRGDHVREKILLHVAPDVQMPVYLLLPKQAVRPLPVMLAFHGHGYGVKDIVGLWEDGRERRTPDGYHADFALALCRRGFAVAAPEISCFGERQTDFSHLNTTIGMGVPSTCTHAAMLAFHLGGSVVGMRVQEGRRLVDYLATRRELDTRRLGAMGISGGGMHTFFSAALDPRIRACVVSGYYSTFRDSVLAMQHCACNFVPGLQAFGEMHDLVGLIAPRPMLVEAGTYDPIFPVAAVRRGVTRARAVYRVFGCPENVQVDIFEGRHRIHGARAYDFLAAQLGA
jgi:dienelactone hydrolase